MSSVPSSREKPRDFSMREKRVSPTPGRVRYWGWMPAKTPYRVGWYITVDETSARVVFKSEGSLWDASGYSLIDRDNESGYHRPLFVVFELEEALENEFGEVCP